MQRHFWYFTVAWCIGLVPSAQADTRMDLFQKQSAVLDGRLSDQYKGAALSIAPSVQPATVPRYNGPVTQHTSLARKMARRHGIPEDLFLRLIKQESGWRVSARSHKGAIGLTQLMPTTAKELGVNPKDPQQNLEGGARYLAQQYRRFGSWRLALAAYNAGPGAVQRHGGVPPFKETQNYVRIILGS